LFERPVGAGLVTRGATLLRTWRELQAALGADAAQRDELERALQQAHAGPSAGGAGGLWSAGRDGLYRVVRAQEWYAGYCVARVDLLARLGEQAEREASAQRLRVVVHDGAATPSAVARPLARLALAAPLGDVRLEAYAADPRALDLSTRWQARLYRWGVFLLGAGVLTGVGLVLRVATREIALARERTRFAASVSHDLRTPLASMRMLAESLLLGSIQDERMRRTFLETLVRECDRLGQLTDRALYFMRMGQNALAVQLTEGEIGSFVRETTQAFGARSREGGVELTTEIEPGLPPVRFDAGALAQVLHNLLDNAVKYTPTPPRRVEVRVARHLNGREVVISVRDHGMGLGPRDRARLFREYYRGRKAREAGIAGSGLGLALCRSIVRAHGGRMEVDSVEGRGSTFRAILPVAEGEEDLRP
jgi:signal transduction histidine kinase